MYASHLRVENSPRHTQSVAATIFGFFLVRLPPPPHVQCMYVSFIGLRLTKTSLTLINRDSIAPGLDPGQSAGYPQAQIGIDSNIKYSFLRNNIFSFDNFVERDW